MMNPQDDKELKATLIGVIKGIRELGPLGWADDLWADRIISLLAKHGYIKEGPSGLVVAEMCTAKNRPNYCEGYDGRPECKLLPQGNGRSNCKGEIQKDIPISKLPGILKSVIAVRDYDDPRCPDCHDYTITCAECEDHTRSGKLEEALTYKGGKIIIKAV